MYKTKYLILCVTYIMYNLICFNQSFHFDLMKLKSLLVVDFMGIEVII